jgi:hypothetical protein
MSSVFSKLIIKESRREIRDMVLYFSWFLELKDPIAFIAGKTICVLTLDGGEIRRACRFV